MSEHIRRRVFVSSVMRGGYGEFRRAAREAIEALQHEAVVVGMTVSAHDSSSQQACLDAVAECDIVILLLGREYGYVDDGKSATHQEWDKARELGKAILVFKEDVGEADIEESQQSFIEEVGHYRTGRHWARFRTSEDLLREIVAALRNHDLATSPSAVPTALESLPPTCRQGIEVLQAINPTTARHLLSLMSSPTARQADVISRIMDGPPDWLQEADYLAWEVLAKFIDAYDLGGSDKALEHALQLGSPNDIAIKAQLAGSQFDLGDIPAARQLIASMPEEHSLAIALNSMLDDDPAAAIEQIQSSQLHLSEDREIALQAVMLLRWSYFKLEQFDALCQLLKRANERFPGRAALVLHQGVATLAHAEQIGVEATGSAELLNAALSELLRARDMFREWNGPSSKATALAMHTALAMKDLDRVVELGTPVPDGEATENESRFGDVQLIFAQACLLLGKIEDIGSLDFEAVDHQDIAYVRAMHAHASGDIAAAERMRNAVNEADDTPALKRALFGLALCGETDAEQSASLPDSDTALFQAIAAHSRGQFEETMEHLGPHRLSTALHADVYARAQAACGDPEGAATVLLDAAENLAIESLRISATECLIEASQLDRAERLAHDLMSRISTDFERRQLRRILVHIAQENGDWPALEARARALFDEFPDDADAPWSVVYALHRQVLNRKAWAFRVSHDLVPIDDVQARLSIVVSGNAGMAHDEANAILQLGERFRDSEKASGAALLALYALGDDVELTKDQIERAQALLEDHVTRFPESSLLQLVTGEGPEDLVEIMTADVRQRAAFIHVIGSKVRHGLESYGQMAKMLRVPYADVLLERAAGGMTAIAFDAAERYLELEVANSALGRAVAVDTSAIVFSFWIDIEFRRLAEAFERVLLADELLYDARMALQRARISPVASFRYDIGSARRNVYEYSEEERAAMLERPAQLLEMMDGIHMAQSSSIRAPLPDEEGHQHWDAAVRIAQSRGVPLWSDDLALRRYAREQEVESFGTWALYEVLAPLAAWAWLPDKSTFQMTLLKAQVADVPVPLADLVRQARSDAGLDTGIAALLRRPLGWALAPTDTKEWFLHRVTHLSQHQNGNNIPDLLYAACTGRGLLADHQEAEAAVGELLASTIDAIGETADVRRLVGAARYAMNELTLGSGPDPLLATISYLLNN